MKGQWGLRCTGRQTVHRLQYKHNNTSHVTDRQTDRQTGRDEGGKKEKRRDRKKERLKEQTLNITKKTSQLLHYTKVKMLIFELCIYFTQ